MPVTRTFLGWDGPPLVRACEELFLARPEGDFASLLVVTPGGRVGRLLQGLMVDRAEELGVPLSPPTFITPGELADAVARPVGRPATPVQKKVAWVRALRAAGHEEVAALLPRAPGDEDQRGWMALGSLLSRTHEELAGEGLRFGDVVKHLDGAAAYLEAERWNAAAAVQRRYEEQLKEAGLVDPDLASIETIAGRPSASANVVLVGVTELSGVARQALGLEGVEATAMVFAPEEESEAFDEFGCVIAEAWAGREVPLEDSAIAFADGPEDQALCAMEAMARLGGRYAVHQIAVGVPDEEVSPRLERAARRYGGVEARPASGVSIMTSGVYRVAAAIERVLEEGTFAALAGLVREPDVERYLMRKLRTGPRERWLAEMDEYAKEHLPGGGVLDCALVGSKREVLEQVQRCVRQLLAGLRGERVEPVELLRVMERVYGARRANRENPADRVEIRASEMIRDVVAQVAALPEDWHPGAGAALLREVLDAVGKQRLPLESSAEALELLGWLEVPLDPAPVAIVTGMNEGTVPEGLGAQPLLPDSLRARLGIACAERRLARDTYLMTLVARSRERVFVICGRKGADGDPRSPSRLLFAGDAETVVRRVRRFVGDERGGQDRVKLAAKEAMSGRDGFERLPMVEAGKVNSMRVTAFRDYIESPYRFYLRHVVEVEEVEATAELEAMPFGSLIHEVLQRFGHPHSRNLVDEGAIRDCLLDHLGALVRSTYGSEPSVVVRVQAEFAKFRLEEFARWQAGRRGMGWVITEVEWKPPDEGVLLPGMEEEFYIRGKIDRIDVHEERGAAILDYKTSVTADAPEKTHGKPGKWKDLQLPLYRHLAGPLKLRDGPGGGTRPLTLGYVAIPAEQGQVGIKAAGWTDEQLSDADRAARHIASRVLAGDFKDAGDKPPTKGTLAALCGTDLLRGAGGGE